MEMNSESPVEWVKDSADKYLYLYHLDVHFALISLYIRERSICLKLNFYIGLQTDYISWNSHLSHNRAYRREAGLLLQN